MKPGVGWGDGAGTRGRQKGHCRGGETWEHGGWQGRVGFIMTLRRQVWMTVGKVRYGAPEEKLFGGKEVCEFSFRLPLCYIMSIFRLYEPTCPPLSWKDLGDEKIVEKDRNIPENRGLRAPTAPSSSIAGLLSGGGKTALIPLQRVRGGFLAMSVPQSSVEGACWIAPCCETNLLSC